MPIRVREDWRELAEEMKVSIVPLLAGVDTLVLSTRNMLCGELVRQISEMKAHASENNVEVPYRIPIGNYVMMVQPRGSRNGDALLLNDDLALHLRFSECKVETMPNAIIEFRSQYLWSEDWESVVKQVLKVLGSIIQGDDLWHISRVDLCVDFQGWTLSERDLSRFVAPGKLSSATYRTGMRVQGVRFGSGNRVMRNYNKRDEILDSSGKRYFFDLYKNTPEYIYEDSEGRIADVMRLEYQMRRKGLQSFSRETGFAIDTVDDFVAAAGSLWRYMTGSKDATGKGWVRLAVPDRKDKTRARWLDDKRWVFLRECVEEGEKITKLHRRKLQRAQGMMSTVAGYLGSVVALLCVQNEGDANDVVSSIVSDRVVGSRVPEKLGDMFHEVIAVANQERKDNGKAPLGSRETLRVVASLMIKSGAIDLDRMKPRVMKMLDDENIVEVITSKRQKRAGLSGEHEYEQMINEIRSAEHEKGYKEAEAYYLRLMGAE